MEDDRYKIRNDKIKEHLLNTGRVFKESMPAGWGFTLFMFNYGEGGHPGDGIFYLSSAQRDDMIKSLEEFIKNEKNNHRSN